MTNEELKKKIVEIIQSVDFYDGLLYRYCIDIATADKLADALIAAGIGDVRTAQEIGASATAMAVLEAAKAEHRAEVAERALKIATELGELCAPVEDYIKQAEKELAEEGSDD